MSPLKIQMLLHFHAYCESYDDRGGNAQREAFHHFLSERLITEVAIHQGASIYGRFYRTTDRGRAMVEALCAVKLPICKWVQPEATDE